MGQPRSAFYIGGLCLNKQPQSTQMAPAFLPSWVGGGSDMLWLGSQLDRTGNMNRCIQDLVPRTASDLFRPAFESFRSWNLSVLGTMGLKQVAHQYHLNVKNKVSMSSLHPKNNKRRSIPFVS